MGFLGASGGRSFFEKQAKLTVGFDEGPKSRLPQNIRQAAIAVQAMVAFNQASALVAQVLREKAELVQGFDPPRAGPHGLDEMPHKFLCVHAWEGSPRPRPLIGRVKRGRCQGEGKVLFPNLNLDVLI